MLTIPRACVSSHHRLLPHKEYVKGQEAGCSPSWLWRGNRKLTKHFSASGRKKWRCQRIQCEWGSVKCRLCGENSFLLEIFIIFLTEGAEITDKVEFLDCFRLVSAIVKYLSVRNVWAPRAEAFGEQQKIFSRSLLILLSNHHDQLLLHTWKLLLGFNCTLTCSSY